MKETVTESRFVNAFDEANRADNFTRAARRALFEHFESIEDDCDFEIEFDVIAICCSWTQYDSLQECLDEYGDEFQTLDDLRDSTTVIEITGLAICDDSTSTRFVDVDEGVLIEQF